MYYRTFKHTVIALQPELGEWIFALLSAQPTPYEPSMASRMRNVCKSCRKLRALLVSSHLNIKSFYLSPSQQSLQQKILIMNITNIFILLLYQYQKLIKHF